MPGHLFRPTLNLPAKKRSSGSGGAIADPYFSDVVVLLGADTYYSPYDLAVKYINSPILSTTKKKTGTHSYYLNAGPYIEIVDSNIATGTGVFTVEYWIYLINGGHGDNYSRPATTITDANGWTFYTTTTNPDTINFDAGLSAGCGAGTVANNTWTHIAVTRESDTKFRCYKDGVLISTSGANSVNFSNTTLRIGCSSNGVARINAYLDSFRLTKAVRYSSSGFNPLTDTYL